MKFLYSNYDIYTSLGLAVDAGLSYYNSEKSSLSVLCSKYRCTVETLQ